MSPLPDFLPVVQMDTDMADSQNDGGQEHKRVFPVNPQQEESRCRKRRTGDGDPCQAALKILLGFLTPEIPDPIHLV